MKKRQPRTNNQLQQKEIMNVGIYLRVSTDEQAQQGYGLDVQRARCNAQALAKGWTVIGEYSDEGISGTKDATVRFGLSTMLDAAESGKIDAVIVLALDRLGRKTSLVLNLVEQLNEVGVALVSCKESLDTSTPQGQFVLTMFAALAQLERDTIVERTTAGRNERGKIDGEKGGRLPLGYMRVGEDRIVIDPEQADTVRYIFGLRQQGYTLQSIAGQLNSEAVSTARASQGYRGIWYASSVREVLLNEAAYRGGTRGSSAVRWEPILIP